MKSKQAQLEAIIKNPIELIKLSLSLNKINKNLEDNKNIFKNKYVMYVP